MNRFLLIGLAATALCSFGLASAEQYQANPGATITRTTPPGPGRLTARAPDLIPIPSRIEHGVVSVRNAGSVASAPSVVTVNCHRPGQEGGCVDIPAAYIAQYTDAAYPNRLVVQVPAIQPGHVYNHNLPFWDEMDWPEGEAFQFDYVADAGNTVGETNEGNNAGSHTWTP